MKLIYLNQVCVLEKFSKTDFYFYLCGGHRGKCDTF